MKLAITGGTGSLGRQLISDYLASGIDKIRVLSRDEHKHTILEERFGKDRVQCFVVDVRDYERLKDTLYGCDVVIHAAALKKVDGTPYNLVEHRKTNIAGTVNVLRAALEAGVDKVLTVSSDKAVLPQNAYGASKMWAELETTHFNSHGYPRGLKSSCVRYGNVFGSTGSVIPIWKKAKEKGDPIKVSNFNMTRFHITLLEASRFCMTAVDEMIGGEIFVPKLPSWNLHTIFDLICGVNSDYTIIGRRAGGEKLHEQLLNEEEATRTLDSGWAYTVKPIVRTWSDKHYFGDTELTHISDKIPYRSDLNEDWVSIETLKEVLYNELRS